MCLMNRLLLCLSCMFSFFTPVFASHIINLLDEARGYCGDYWAGGQRALNVRLRDAVSRGNRSQVISLLAQNASPNSRDGSQGYSPLMVAVQHRRLDMVRDLLDAGASDSINWQHEGGGAALLFAAENGDSIMVKELLSAGALVFVNGCGYSPIGYAARGGHDDVVCELICAQKGIRLTDETKELMLMILFNMRLYDIAEKLILAGADLHVVNEEGFTIFDMAHTPEQQVVLGRAIEKRNKIRIVKRNVVEAYVTEIEGIVAIVLDYESMNGSGVLRGAQGVEWENKEAQIQRAYEQSWEGRARTGAHKILVAATALVQRSH